MIEFCMKLMVTAMLMLVLWTIGMDWLFTKWMDKMEFENRARNNMLQKLLAVEEERWHTKQARRKMKLLKKFGPKFVESEEGQQNATHS